MQLSYIRFNINFRILKIASIFLVFLTSCADEKSEKESTEEAIPVNYEEGKKLTLRYCQNCHMYPQPELLPKHIWKDEVLPRMGAFYGIYDKESRKELLEGGEARKFLLANNVYPEKPQIDTNNWKKIKRYILDLAPDKLDSTRVSLETKELFAIETPRARISPPMSTLMQFESASGLIYHGDVKKDYSTINIFDKNLKPVQSLGVRSPAVKIRENGDELWALLMGSFTSTDKPTGSIVKFSKINGSPDYKKMDVVIDGLQRPVDMSFSDFDNDGDEDIVVAEFGNWAGRLEWFEKTGNSQYERHLLLQKTGPVRVISEDLNNDGFTDIMAMVAQGDESMYTFLNQGNGEFNMKKIFQLPPTHGSVSFEYLDIDKDGIKDIVHVAGDNADYEAILKSYHGIRILKGLGNLEFRQTLFYPVHGAYNAKPADYDGDGDLDLAVISFFPDYSDDAKESLMMLRNDSTKDSLIFDGFTVNGYNMGRWNVMDNGDVNKDGRPDLMLASFVVQNPYTNQEGTTEEWMKDSPMFVLLKNKWK